MPAATDGPSPSLPEVGANVRRRRSSGQQAADYIKQLIFDGHLRPGERVPQDAIAAVLDVSRIPIREGLIALERDGWVTIELNRGAYVNALDAAALRDNYELFGLIYGFATRRAMERGADGLVEELVAIDKRMRATDDPVEFGLATLDFHASIVKASRSPRVKAMLRSSSGLVSGNFFEEIPGSIEVERRGSAAIVRALRKGDVPKAVEQYRQMMVRQGELVVQAFDARGLFNTKPEQGLETG